MKQVSIIIPAYNPGHYLTKAVESVLGQTFAGWELIVVDDGSAEAVAPLVPVDGRVAVIRQDNRGLSAARNAGIERSRGELVAFLDADDLWLPNKLEQQVAALDARPDAVLCHTQMRFIDATGTEGGLGWGGGYETYDELLDGCGVCASSVIIRRNALFACGLFNPLLYAAQDYDLWLKATRLGPMVAISDPLTLYRLHDENMSRNYLRTHREISSILREHLRLARNAGEAERVSKCRRGMRRTGRSTAMQAMQAMALAVKKGAIFAAAKHFWFAALSSPLCVAEKLPANVGRTAGRLGR